MSESSDKQHITKYLQEKFGKNSPMTLYTKNLVRASEVIRKTSFDPDTGKLLSVCDREGKFKMSWHWHFARIGGVMEREDQLIKSLNCELEESKKILQNLANDISAVAEITEPQLMNHVKRLREARMTAVREMTQTLQSMKEIRKFLFEQNYHEEMNRLKEFVSLCREIKELKAEGVLDAVADIAIRLSVKEESNGGK